MATMVFVLVLIVPLHFSSDDVRDNEHNNHIYAPKDTAIISFTHPFCDKLTLHSPDSEFDVEVTLYLLGQVPVLGREDKATFYRDPRLTNTYEYWRMFLYPGSKVGYSACSIESTEPPVTFYLVKGNRNYEKWRFDHSNAVLREEITASCGTSSNNTFNYEVESEDNYYFIFDSEATSMTSVTGVTFDFKRVLYDVSINSSIVTQCSIILNDSTSCQVSVPLSSKPVALLELASLVPDPMQWDADVRVYVSCSARGWIYAVITLSTIAFVGLLATSALLTRLCFCSKKKDNAASRDTSQSEDSQLIREHSQKPVYNAPPSYEP